MNTFVLFYDDVGEIRNIYDKETQASSHDAIVSQLPNCKIMEVTTEKSLLEIGTGHHFVGDELVEGMHPNRIESMRLKGIGNERRFSYPQISEQLDMLYRDIVNGTLTAETSEFVRTLKTIKDMYPKYLE